jgi:hypothetical protein
MSSINRAHLQLLGQTRNFNLDSTITGGDLPTGVFSALQVITEAVLTSYTDETEEGEAVGLLAGETLPAGLILYGKFSDVVVASGLIRLYN